eukprot:TRINITY_DN10052_c1_g1_i2.p1 TRINITY_DN10052_c1_g1~~TRINITY_DN10052_c1_g1_i2.p1  ORF type:complete len:369 (+),score=49.24 TRINITY_DN10052_c1_g1_i2:156-1262(+)
MMNRGCREATLLPIQEADSSSDSSSVMQQMKSSNSSPEVAGSYGYLRGNQGHPSLSKLYRRKNSSGNVEPCAEDALSDADSSESEDADTLDLPESIWALGLAAIMGQARYENGALVENGTFVAITTTLVIFSLQFTTIFLIVHDIDPTAAPITVTPSTKWVHSPWTVNAMKCFMIFFVASIMISEVSQCLDVAQVALVLPRRLSRVPRWVPIIIPALQYLLVLAVVWAGVAVVLSCQAVPDILYNSLSITFVASTDDVLYHLLMRLAGFQDDLRITVYRSDLENGRDSVNGENGENGARTYRKHLDDGDASSDMEDLDLAYKLKEDPPIQANLAKALLLLPYIFALYVSISACLKNQMPTVGLGIHEI